MRIIRAPHQCFHAELVDQLGADAIELERCLALALPVIAGLHRQAKIAEAVFPFKIHAVEHIGYPADAAFAEGNAQLGITLQYRGADHRGDDLRQVQLKAAHARELRGAPGFLGRALAFLRRDRGEGVKVKRHIQLAHRLPQRLPHFLIHRRHVPRARQFQPAQAQLDRAPRFLASGVDVVKRQAGKADHAIRVGAAKIRQPGVVDAKHFVRRFIIAQPRGGAEYAEDDLGIHAIALGILHP